MGLKYDRKGRFCREVTDGDITIWQAEYLTGMTYKQISVKYNRSVETVYRYICPDIKGRAWGGIWKSRSLRDLTDLESAYLAGLFDGEGTVRVSKIDTRGGVRYYSRACIVNTDLNVLDWLKSLGGTFYWKQPTGFGNKPVGCWQVSATTDVDYFLKSLLPYSIIKYDKIVESLGVLNERILVRNSALKIEVRQ